VVGDTAVRSNLLIGIGAALVLLCGTARADDEAAKAAFLACRSMDMNACDQLVAMPGLTDIVRGRAYVLRGLVHLKGGDLQGARADIASAQKFDPTSDMAVQVSQMIDQAGQQQEATPEMQCFHASDLQKRLAACNAFVAKHDGDASRAALAYDGRAAVESQLEKFPAAIADLKTANRLDPNRVDGQWHLMIVEFEAGKYKDALAAADAALAVAPTNADLLAHRGILLYLTGQPVPALDALAAASQQSNSDMTRFIIDVIRLEQHQDVSADLRQLMASPTMTGFGLVLLRFRLGEVSTDAVLDEAKSLPSQQRQIALSQAYFSIGHQAWLAGNLPVARDNFRLAVKAHLLDSFDYHASRMILQKIAG
jgi:lipoprotein NlpI